MNERKVDMSRSYHAHRSQFEEETAKLINYNPQNKNMAHQEKETWKA